MLVALVEVALVLVRLAMVEEPVSKMPSVEVSGVK